MNALKDNAGMQSQAIEEVGRSLAQVIAALHNFCGDLRPPTLTSFGLEKAIRSHAEAFRESHPELKIRLELMPDGQRLSDPVRLALFRIYQSTLSNTVRHAHAHHLIVRLGMKPEEVILEVLDDGIGFALPERPVELARRGHLGIVGAQERALAVGGTMDILSSPGQGTRIRVAVPLPAPS